MEEAIRLNSIILQNKLNFYTCNLKSIEKIVR